MQRFWSTKQLFNYLIKKKMKKLVLLLAVTFSVSLFSCGGNDKKAEADSAAVDSAVLVEETVVVEEVVDSAATDSAATDSAVVAE